MFETARIFFLVLNHQESRQLPLLTNLKTLFYGARMDASMAAYITLPVCLMLLVAHAWPFLQKPTAYRVYTGIILFPILLIIFCDIPAYQAWGYRLDVTPVKYLASPKEAWASVGHLPVFWILFFFLLIYWFLAKGLSQYIGKQLNEGKEKGRTLLSLLLMLVFTAGLIIPLRGGLQLAPINQSSVYFSDKQFANLAAINVTWNFMHSISHNTADTKNPYPYLNKPEADSLVSSLLQNSGPVSALVDTNRVKKTNLIVIVWESFTSKAVGQSWNGIEISPGFNRLIKEGVYFDHIYASGDRTDKGIVAVLSGYPAQPVTSIVKIPRKATSLPNLASVYHKLGYRTSFTYGGELEFANMKAYLMGSGFDRFTSKDDFSGRDQNSKWGAHDHVVKDSLQHQLSTIQEPFFSTWLTLSSHEPYETPNPGVIPGNKDVDQFLNSIHYTDSCVYSFVQYCKQQDWWNNTLLVIVADHGHRLPYTGKKVNDFKIPLLFLGGALREQGRVINSVGSQVDIASTILHATGRQADASQFHWSRNLFGLPETGWAYFCFNNGFGYVNPGGYMIYDNVGNQVIEQAGKLTQEDIRKGKALQQMTMEDYLGR